MNVKPLIRKKRLGEALTPQEIAGLVTAFMNGTVPDYQVSALLMAGLLNGAVVAEVIFAWPGVGRIALVEAVHNNDFPLLLGAVLFFAVIYLFFNLLADVLYGVIDPRIRYD